MALDGDEVEDDDDRDMLLLSLLLCWNAALQRGPCDLPLVWVHVRVVESLWLQWPVAAGCGKPVAAMACGRWLWKAFTPSLENREMVALEPVGSRGAAELDAEGERGPGTTRPRNGSTSMEWGTPPSSSLPYGKPWPNAPCPWAELSCCLPPDWDPDGAPLPARLPPAPPPGF